MPRGFDMRAHMLHGYLKIALKVLIRRKFFTAISLFGIGFTLTVLLVVAALVDTILAPGAPETRLNRTLHITHLSAENTGPNGHWFQFHEAPGYALLDRYARGIPGVQAFSIVSGAQSVTGFVHGEKIVSALRHVDAAYWNILQFRFLEGGPFTETDDEQGNLVAVISQATRKRFFGDAPAAGKDLELDGRRYRVVGVVQNVPLFRRSATADIWAPHGSARSQSFRTQLTSSRWSGTPFEGLLLAQSRADFPRIRSEFESRLAHVENEVVLPPRPGDDGATRRMSTTLRGIPLTRLQQYAMDLAARPSRDARPPTGQVALILLVMLGAFLLLPTANLVTINLTRFLERTQEIGVRKTFGATEGDLLGQFILENILLCVIGALLALVAAAEILHVIEASGLLPYANLHINIRVFFYGIAMAALFGLLSGVYPAWRTARLHPVEAMRGGIR